MSWVAIFPAETLTGLAELRTHPRVEVAELSGEFAVRFSDSELVPVFMHSASQLYQVTEQGLVPEGARVAMRERLPEGLPWRSLADVWGVGWREVSDARKPSRTASLKLCRDHTPRSSAALLTNLTDLCAWAERSAVIRLEGLRYAAAGSGEVWVLGSLLPSVPGQSYWHYGAEVYLPSGQRLETTVSPGQLRRAIAGREKSCVLAREEGWEEIPSECIVPLTRAGLRGSLLLEGLGEE